MNRFLLTLMILSTSLCVTSAYAQEANANSSYYANVRAGAIANAQALTTTGYFNYRYSGSGTLQVSGFPSTVSAYSGNQGVTIITTGTATADWEYDAGTTGARSYVMQDPSTVAIYANGKIANGGYATSSIGLGDTVLSGYTQGLIPYMLEGKVTQPRLQWENGQYESLTGNILAEIRR